MLLTSSWLVPKSHINSLTLLFALLCAACCRFESEHSVVLRFIIGSSANASDELALQQEEQEHGDFMRLPLQVAAQLHTVEWVPARCSLRHSLIS